MPVDVSILAQLPLFKGLSTTELEEIAARVVLDQAPAGVSIIREGDATSHPFFILVQGSVEVIKRGLDGRGRVISTLAAPSVFGEIEILARRPAIASVNAVSDVRLATLSRGEFDQMCQGNRAAALKMVRNLAQVLSYRLAATDDRLAAQFDLSVADNADKVGKIRQVIHGDWKPLG